MLHDSPLAVDKKHSRINADAPVALLHFRSYVSSLKSNAELPDVIVPNGIRVGKFENSIRVRSYNAEALRGIPLVERNQQRRGFHARRTVREPKIDQVRLCAELFGVDGLPCEGFCGERRGLSSLPTGYAVFDALAESRIRHDRVDVYLCNFAGARIPFHELRHTRIGFHDSQDHVHLSRHLELKLVR